MKALVHFVLIVAVANARIIIVPALSRIQELGDLFDESSHTFTGRSIFDDKPKDEIKSSREKEETETTFSMSNTYRDKFKSLNIEGSFAVSILMGTLKLGGSGKYLNAKKESSSTIRGSVFYTLRRGIDFLRLSHKNFLSSINKEALYLIPDSTHFLLRITRGGRAITEFESQITETVDATVIQGKMHAAYDKLKTLFSVSGKVEVDSGDQEKFKDSKLNFKIYADCKLEKDPVTIEELLDVAKSLPKCIRDVASGSGHSYQLEYILYPLSRLKKLLKYEAPKEKMNKKLSLARNEAIIEIFDRCYIATQSVTDLYRDTQMHKNFLRFTDTENIATLMSHWNSAYIKFIADLQSAMDNFTSQAPLSTIDESRIQSVLSHFEKDEKLSPNKVISRVRSDFNQCSFNIKLVKQCESNGIVALANNVALEEIKLKYNNEKIYVFFDHGQGTSYPENWLVSFISFTRINSKYKKFYVNCRVTAEKCRSSSETMIQEYAFGLNLNNIPTIDEEKYAAYIAGNSELHRVIFGYIETADSLVERINDFSKEFEQLQSHYQASKVTSKCIARTFNNPSFNICLATEEPTTPMPTMTVPITTISTTPKFKEPTTTPSQNTFRSVSNRKRKTNTVIDRLTFPVHRLSPYESLNVTAKVEEEEEKFLPFVPMHSLLNMQQLDDADDDEPTTPVSTLTSTLASTSTPTPASTSISTPFSTSTSTLASTSTSTQVSTSTSSTSPPTSTSTQNPSTVTRLDPVVLKHTDNKLMADLHERLLKLQVTSTTEKPKRKRIFVKNPYRDFLG